MRYLVLNLAIFSMLVLSFAPTGQAHAGVSSDIPHMSIATPKDDTASKKSTPNFWSFFAETFETAEAEEKLITDFHNRYTLPISRIGYVLKDQYAIASERQYLPFEPPIS